jgi:hypothetical protein
MEFSNFSPLTDLENLNNTIDLNGVAVLPNVFTNEECEFLKKSVFDYLAKTHNVHEPDDYEKIHPIEGGILHKYGIALIKEVLDMKTDERVEKIFKTIWNNEEVTMSLDGINIAPPPEKITSKRIGTPAGFHTDQSSDKKEKCCIQSFINLEHTDDGDGCLSVLKHSNRLHAAFFKHFDVKSYDDWFVIDSNDYKWFLANGCKL